MMRSIAREALPQDALLNTYRGGMRPERWGAYGDCFSVTVERAVSLAEYVFAFYTSPVFRIERLILQVCVGMPSNDAAARALANGSAASFAVWYVGQRTNTQLLMCDRYERTRSWFRAEPVGGDRTLLQFGTAVAAARDNRTGPAALGGGMRLLLRFHVLYSKVLLRAATVGIMRRAASSSSGKSS
ncbi:MAG TPA: hypothetical protein VK793_17710 [Steroidobacteraceae bacterium]|jgi:hypothetical protein|nr:hypothetical protein [Steroidobacteraceae bacterium]